jgi:hypothetical protein
MPARRASIIMAGGAKHVIWTLARHMAISGRVLFTCITSYLSLKFAQCMWLIQSKT